MPRNQGDPQGCWELEGLLVPGSGPVDPSVSLSTPALTTAAGRATPEQP
ncbi:MAG: hypothetical protein OXG33_07990 [Chloroflexi bacterium]|nr:hypothetical protein [Chloroflexota bacterium]